MLLAKPGESQSLIGDPRGVRIATRIPPACASPTRKAMTSWPAPSRRRAVRRSCPRCRRGAGSGSGEGRRGRSPEAWRSRTLRAGSQSSGTSLRKVIGVAFRPDGRRIVTTSADGTARQWDPATGREVESPYERHTGEVVTAAYSPDGLQVASGGTDRTIRIWGAADRHDVAVLQGHTGVVSQLAFAADGRRLASASQSGLLAYGEDGTVRIWELGSQANTSILLGHGSYVYPVADSADGRWIASGSWDKTVCLWDPVSGECCAILPQPGYVAAGLQPGRLVAGRPPLRRAPWAGRGRDPSTSRRDSQRPARPCGRAGGDAPGPASHAVVDRLADPSRTHPGKFRIWAEEIPVPRHNTI